MSKEIMRKLEEHDARFEQHDAMFDFLAVKLFEHDKRFDRLEHEAAFLKIKSIEHDEWFEKIEANMVTKADHQQVMNVLDGIVKYMKKKDEEITMLIHGLHRNEEQAEKNTKEIENLKPALGV